MQGKKSGFHSRHSSGLLRDTATKQPSGTNTRPTTAHILSSAEGGETSGRRFSQNKFLYRLPRARIGSALVKRREQSLQLAPVEARQRRQSPDPQSEAEPGPALTAAPETAPRELRIRVGSFKPKDLHLAVPSPTSPQKADSHSRLGGPSRGWQRRPATATHSGAQIRPRQQGSKPGSPSGQAEGAGGTAEVEEQEQAILQYIDRQMYSKSKVIKKLNEYLKEQPVISDTLLDYKEKLIEFHFQEIKAQLSSKLSQVDFDAVFHRDHHKNLDEKKEMVAAFLLGFSHNTRYKKFCKLFKHYLDKSDARNSSKVGIVKGLVSVSDFWDETFYREVLRQGDYHTIKSQFRKKFKDSHIL